MSACQALTETATAGVAPALRAVDCLANEAAAGAFGRLFGPGGALLPALTLLLTLYVALFAVALLTGRSRLGIAALTPRMMTLGLVLTFVTSWVAYQSVVWNLAVGAPDQIAGVLTGTRGSAVELFGRRIDLLFAAIAEAAASAGGPAQAAGQAVQAGTGAAGQMAGGGAFTPGNLMWLAAILLLLGTVGVLVAARIALAVLLMLGPVFIVLALFDGTRGLFAGWLRGVVLTALAPLFAVIGGGFMLELAVPVVSGLANGVAGGVASGGAGGGAGVDGIDGRAAMALFLVAAVHVALMAMVLRVAATMVAGWSVFGLAKEREGERAGGRDGGHAGRPGAPMAAPMALSPTALSPAALFPAALFPSLAGDRPTGAFAAAMPDASLAAGGPAGRAPGPALAPVVPSPGLPPLPRARARGIGSRFAAPLKTSAESFR